MQLGLSGENAMSDLNFLLDENIPKEVKEFLSSKGFIVKYVPKSVANGKLALLAKEEKSTFVTRDSDFLNNSLYPPKEFFGIIVFRIHPPKAEKLVRALSLLLKEIKDLRGKLFVVEEQGFEISEN